MLYAISKGKGIAAIERAPTPIIENNLLQGHHYLSDYTLNIFSHDQKFFIVYTDIAQRQHSPTLAQTT